MEISYEKSIKVPKYLILNGLKQYDTGICFILEAANWWEQSTTMSDVNLIYFL